MSVVRYGGGAIAIAAGRLELQDSTFVNNKAATGGCIVVASKGTLVRPVEIELDNIEFANNSLRLVPSAIFKGGAVLDANGQHDISIRDSRFEHNWGPYGSGGVGSVISLNGSSTLHIARSSFSHNWGARQAKYSGSSQRTSAALSLESGTATLRGVRFIQNNAHSSSEELFAQAHNTFERWCSLSSTMRDSLAVASGSSSPPDCSQGSNDALALFLPFYPGWQLADGGAIAVGEVCAVNLASTHLCVAEWPAQLH